jgi:hypothetical protein
MQYHNEVEAGMNIDHHNSFQEPKATNQSGFGSVSNCYRLLSKIKLINYNYVAKMDST